MEMVRNFINISGLADEDEIPKNIRGQILQYSEAQTIYIPKSQPDIKSIFQVMIRVEIKSTRSIFTPIGNTIVIDGIKKLKIIYTQNDDSGKANFLDMELPYNTFIESPDRIEPDSIKIYVLDAYFNLLDERRIYSHFIFMVNLPVTVVESNIVRNIMPNKPDKLEPAASSEVLFLENNEGSSPSNESYLEQKHEKIIDKAQILIDLDAEYL